MATGRRQEVAPARSTHTVLLSIAALRRTGRRICILKGTVKKGKTDKKKAARLPKTAARTTTNGSGVLWYLCKKQQLVRT